MFSETPPMIVSFLAESAEALHILTVHPIELARQLTLIEAEMFR